MTAEPKCSPWQTLKVRRSGFGFALAMFGFRMAEVALHVSGMSRMLAPFTVQASCTKGPTLKAI